MWPSTPAGRQHLAWRCRTCCLRASKNSRPLRHLIFRGSIPHPIQSLCTLRDYCRQQPRSGRIEARTGLRMMPTFPRSPLSSVRRVFPDTAARLAFRWSLPGVHTNLSLLPTSAVCSPVYVHPKYTSWSNGYPAQCRVVDSIVHRHEVGVPRPQGSSLLLELCCLEIGRFWRLTALILALPAHFTTASFSGQRLGNNSPGKPKGSYYGPKALLGYA